MKVASKQCHAGKFKDEKVDLKYDTLDQAQDNCKIIEDCAGVYDEDCDGKDSFKLCPKDSIHPATLSSCAYYKLGEYYSHPS